MPRVVSDPVGRAISGVGEVIGAYRQGLQQEREEKRAQERHELWAQNYQNEIERASQAWMQDQQARQAAQELEGREFEKMAKRERAPARAALRAAQPELEGLAAEAALGGPLALPVVGALASMVPSVTAGLDQEARNMREIASRMDPQYARQYRLDWQRRAAAQIGSAAQQAVLNRTQALAARGAFQVHRPDNLPSPEGLEDASQGVLQEIGLLLQDVEAGAMSPLDAHRQIQGLKEQIVQTNTELAFRSQGLDRIDREIEALEPSSEEAEDMAFIRARWVAGDIEDGDDLEDAIFEARTGRSETKAKSPEELYQRAVGMMVQLKGRLPTQGEVDELTRLFTAGPPDQPMEGPQPGSDVPRGTSNGRRSKKPSPGQPVEHMGAYLQAQAEERKRRGEVGFTREQGGPPVLMDFEQLPEEKQEETVDAIRDILAEPAGSSSMGTLRGLKEALERDRGVRLASVPREVLQALVQDVVTKRKEERKEAEAKLMDTAAPGFL